MPQSIDWPPPRSGRPRRRRFLVILVVLAVIFFAGRAALSYYLDLLWFGSLGYAQVFWKTLSLQWEIFAAVRCGHISYSLRIVPGSEAGASPRFAEGHTIFIGGQPVKLPVEPVLRLIALGISLAIAAATGAAHDGRMVDAGTLLVRASHALVA